MSEEKVRIELPVVTTRGMIVFPGNTLTLDVGRPSSLNAINDSDNLYEKNIIFVSQVNPFEENVNYKNIFHVGTLCTLRKKIRRDQSGIIKLTVEGQQRVKICSLKKKNECFYAKVEFIDDQYGNEEQEVALIRMLAETLETMDSQMQLMPRDVLNGLTSGVSATEFGDSIAHYLNIRLESKQKILATRNVNRRLLLILKELESEKIISEIEQNINRKVRDSIDDNQREYYLREKIRMIKEELGDISNKVDDADGIRQLLKNNPYPQYVKDKVEEELKRYEMMPPASSEASVVRNYLDWIIKTPWYQETTDNDNLEEVERILDADHFGLDKVKERILEQIAVKQMTHSLKSPIICLYGPPGVGKTSLARSIARALNRQFVKASLGGVNDEAEIRGHRRTYLGAMPGRIIQGMKKAGVTNPVFLLDEIDKMSSDYKGDPSSAMLEVLDPEQNSQFSDNYIEEPYDLSNVMFIATANSLDTIPGPLRDRLEIIEVSSYTEQEKYHIAKDHLVPKELANHGLSLEQLSFSEDALMCMIRHYTREAGVRHLERLIGKVCRKVVVKILKEKVSAVYIEEKDIEEYLGKKAFDHTKKLNEAKVGVVTGLAYTQFGGDILPIEVNHYKGTGKLIITGQLGDVMKESASIAYSYIKANIDKYHLDPSLFEKRDVHIHVPEGAIKKDGPSAGVTITTAIYSAFSNTPVRFDVGMTGEMTLRGNVLPIGGLKEKSISAHRSGIKKIIIPTENEKDIEDIPESVRNELEIVLADNIDTVFKHALVQGS